MRIPLASAIVLILSGCAQIHMADVNETMSQRVGLGRIQREIKVGMSGSEVIGVIGSPNIVTTDEERREVWIYDLVATEEVYSSGQGSLFGFNTSILGGGDGLKYGSGSGLYNAGAASNSQRTLTVVIKFDANLKVRDFAYHSTRF